MTPSLVIARPGDPKMGLTLQYRYALHRSDSSGGPVMSELSETGVIPPGQNDCGTKVPNGNPELTGHGEVGDVRGPPTKLNGENWRPRTLEQHKANLGPTRRRGPNALPCAPGRERRLG
jgi:hypothetical protein